MKFKVGDRVRLNAEAKGSNNLFETSLHDKVFTVERTQERGGWQGVTAGELNFVDGLWLEPAPALIQMGGEYQTRDGRKARVLCVDGKHEDFPVTALVTYTGGDEWPLALTADGREFSEGESPNDLIPVPPKPKEWERWFVCGPKQGYATREEAVTAARNWGGLTVKSVKFTDAEGL